MKLQEITPDLVISAAYRIQKRKNRPVSAKDIWYEISGTTRYDKYKPGDARKVSNILHQTKAKEMVTRIKGNTGTVRYLVKEE